jgi:hypothetical protein
VADREKPAPTPENVFALLAAMDETARRRVLRSHRDVPFRGDEKYDKEAMALRSALDIALDRLTVIEVRLETGSVSVPPPTSDHLLTLFDSNAFARFVNSYLYFGVRFIAARLLGPRATDFHPRAGSRSIRRTAARCRPDRQSFDINEVRSRCRIRRRSSLTLSRWSVWTNGAGSSRTMRSTKRSRSSMIACRRPRRNDGSTR